LIFGDKADEHNPLVALIFGCLGKRYIDSAIFIGAACPANGTPAAVSGVKMVRANQKVTLCQSWLMRH
jgi:hypothetical protein